MAWQRSYTVGGVTYSQSSTATAVADPPVKSCVVCGDVVPEGRRTMCGSPRCKSIAGKPSRNRRKAILRGVPTERYQRHEVAESNGWVCALCGSDIPRDVHHLDPLALTVDHITPLTRGGTDLRSNVQPAHRRCNTSKGNR